MGRAAIPDYSLYGESRGRFPDGLHVETIAARSSLHGWRIDPHRHRDMHQFFVLATGGGQARIDGLSHALAPSTAMLVPPFVVHQFRFEPDTDGFVVTVPDVTLKRVREAEWPLADALARPVVQAAEAADPDVGALLGLMAGALAEFAGRAPGRETALAAYAALIATGFARRARPADPTGGEIDDARGALVRRFVERVEAEFRHHRPLGAYARDLGVSTPHLTRLCRQALGCPAVRVIHDRLVLEARRQLAYTSLSVSQIGYGLGFSDPAYFSRFFTIRAGVSPSDYRAGHA